MVNVNDPRTLLLFGTPFHDLSYDEMIAWCLERMQQGAPAMVATANVDFLMQSTRDPELHRILVEADRVIADGMPIVWTSRFFGPRLRQRVTGSDLTPLLAAACARTGMRVFLLGGAPGVAEKAAVALAARHPGLIIAGCYSPPLATLLDMNHADILARLEQARPHLLLVALGAPKQEKFIALHARAWRVPLAIGIGGTLDFLAGVQTRAPRWVQKIGFEWLWRLGTDPARLTRRYAGNIAFLSGALWRFYRLKRSPPGAPTDPAAAAFDRSALSVTGDPQPLIHFFSLGDRSWLDSEELGSITQAAHVMRERRGRLLLYGGTERIARLLVFHGIAPYLDYFPTLAQAREHAARLQDARRQGTVRVLDNRLALELPAELNAASLTEWAGRVNRAWSDDIRQVAIDPSNLVFLDSAALGWLVVLHRRCQENNLALAAGRFHGFPLKTLKLARLDKLFDPPADTAPRSGA
jgi:N-acetylglucosaminyldiphosphoundecaprenol N-acetyl-beta-D-mannosaminyltransferase